MTRPRITFTLPPREAAMSQMGIRADLIDAVGYLNDGNYSTAAHILDAVDDSLNSVVNNQTDPRDNDLWFVQVTVTRPAEGLWTAQRTLPTFVLDGAVQGIDTTLGAATLAADVLLVDVQPKDWRFLATIRRGNTADVWSANLRTLTIWRGDHVTVPEEQLPF